MVFYNHPIPYMPLCLCSKIIHFKDLTTVMPDIRNLFRTRLKNLRHSRGLSQQELSRDCDYSHAYVGEIERGEQDPSFEALRRLADALDVSIVEFFVIPGEGHLTENLEESIATVTDEAYSIIRSRMLIESIVDNPYRMAGVWDPTGRILDYNRAVESIVHTDAMNLLGKDGWSSKIFDLDGEYRDWMKDRLRKMQDHPGIYRRTMVLLSKDGEHIETEFTMTPMNRESNDESFVLVEGQRTEDIREG